jgi:DNA-directed RNA polymerase subunit RPC12/RpoP
MTRTLGWARLWAVANATKLRSGAWYPITSDHERSVDLEVAGGTVTVPRTLVETRDQQPNRFTVVYRPVDSHNPAAGTKANVGNTYAVCPYSGSRVKLSGRPEYVECRECGYRGLVAWWETG